MNMFKKMQCNSYLKRLKAVFKDDPEILESWTKNMDHYISTGEYSPLYFFYGGYSYLDALYSKYGNYRDETLDYAGEMRVNKTTRSGKFVSYKGQFEYETKINPDMNIRSYLRTYAIWCSFKGLDGAKSFFRKLSVLSNTELLGSSDYAIKKFRSYPEFGEELVPFLQTEAVCKHFPNFCIKPNPIDLGDALYAICLGFKKEEFKDNNEECLNNRIQQIYKLLSIYPKLSEYFENCEKEENLLSAFISAAEYEPAFQKNLVKDDDDFMDIF